jgi:hypothetical protein
MPQQFQTHKRDFSKTQIVEYSDAPLANHEVRCAITNYAFTANNITYAVVGERIRYWEFFPAHNSDNTDWGVIPVWGFAEVTESKSDEIAVGEKIFGYFPPATTVTIKPSRVSPVTLIDASEHRATLPPTYNSYRRVSNEPNYSADFDNERMLLFPLYATAYCIHDMFQDKKWFGAEQVVVISASSKTSLGTAYAIAEDDTAPSLIGLTSSRNLDFVNSLSIYDSVVDYQDIETIDANKPTVIVDMSANGEVLGRLHKHLGANMKFCSNVGITHWDDSKMGPDFIAERSQQFFAPGHMQKRIAEWGGKQFYEKSNDFVMRTAAKSKQWMDINYVEGLTGLNSIYPDVLNGNASPKEGIIISM